MRDHCFAICVAGTDASVGTDAGGRDAATSGRASYYELNAMRTTDPMIECRSEGEAYLVIGRVGDATDGTSFQFTFRGIPADGDHFLEAATALDIPPADGANVFAGYASHVAGADQLHMGQIGTVTVRREGTSLRVATATMITSQEVASGAMGTIAANISCP